LHWLFTEERIQVFSVTPFLLIDALNHLSKHQVIELWATSLQTTDGSFLLFKLLNVCSKQEFAKVVIRKRDAHLTAIRIEVSKHTSHKFTVHLLAPIPIIPESSDTRSLFLPYALERLRVSLLIYKLTCASIALGPSVILGVVNL